MKKFLNKKKKGYAITIEVIATLAIMALFVNSTIYILNSFNIQRYMNTIATSTLIQASKYGGNDSNAYRATGANKTIEQNAQDQLDEMCSSFNPVITVSPNKITELNNEITVTLSWEYPGMIFPDIKMNPFGVQEATYKIDAIMSPGNLL